MSCLERREDLDREFLGDVADPVGLAKHLETCAECRAYRDQLARIDTMLEKGALGPGKIDALEARLFDRLGVKQNTQLPTAAVAAKKSRSWVGVSAFAAMAAAAVLTFVLWPKPVDDAFTPRGGGDSSFGVRAFCVQDGSVKSEARAGGTLKCGAGQFVQLTYTSPGAGTLEVALDDSQPLSPEFPSMAVDGGIDVALPFSNPVSAEWLSRPRTVTARFVDSKGREVQSSVVVAPIP